MKYYIIAGEVSGDLHASNLMKQLIRLDPEANFRCWGGDRMQSHGGVLVKHIRDLAFMGFWEVFVNLRTITRNLRLCKKDLTEYKPDVLILIDYPGFNLRIAEFAKNRGIRVVYYISPQVWAWKQSRVKMIRKYVDKMLVILPFEKAFYEKFDYQVEFPGHPLIDALREDSFLESAEQFIQQNNLSAKPIVALLPGSREQEISRMLQEMLAVTPYFPQVQFVIAGLSVLGDDFYGSFSSSENISLVLDETYPLLLNSQAAIVASGTATLETALLNVPQIVCYKAGKISYEIARRLIKVKYISLVNLVMDKPVVRELIQDDFNVDSVKKELQRLLFDEKYRQHMMDDYQVLKQKLGGEGASRNAAEIIYQLVTANE
jgi:lipid-A-disaccharide synthase